MHIQSSVKNDSLAKVCRNCIRCDSFEKNGVEHNVCLIGRDMPSKKGRCDHKKPKEPSNG